MKVKNIELTSFRNIEYEKLDFNEGVNVIYGDNAQGKTNILEGIYIFARGKSFRASKDKELIKFGKNTAYSLLNFNNSSGDTTLGVEISSSKPRPASRPSGRSFSMMRRTVSAFRGSR